MKPNPPSPSAPAVLKWSVYSLSALLTILWIWLLGFVLRDIGDLRGPDFEAIQSRHVDASLVAQAGSLQKEIQSLQVRIARQQEIQSNLRSSMDNAQATMEQMMNLHRLGLERGVNPTETQQEALATSQQRFIEAQERFEQANSEIAVSNQRKFELGQDLESVNERLAEQREPANEEYRNVLKSHRFKVASLKLLFIVPIFMIAGFLVHRKRESLFRPIFLSLLVASFWKVGSVMFEHFPREFFKYIAIAAAILIVLAFLIWILRRVARPGPDLLVKRYREAYQRHRCPICDYPIMRGALKHAIWSRKGPRLATGPPTAAPHPEADAQYACPACGAPLFEACSSCGKPRHSLLPFCEHCGHENPLPAGIPEG